MNDKRREETIYERKEETRIQDKKRNTYKKKDNSIPIILYIKNMKTAVSLGYYKNKGMNRQLVYPGSLCLWL